VAPKQKNVSPSENVSDNEPSPERKLYELYWLPHIICTYAEGIE